MDETTTISSKRLLKLRAVATLVIFIVSSLFSAPSSADESKGADEGYGRDLIAGWLAGKPDLRTLSRDRIQWPDPTEIESLIALGFSEDGWFVYANRVDELVLDEPRGACRGQLPCFDISLLNVLCDDPCAGDIDPSAGPKCECLQEASLPVLEESGVRFNQKMEFGEFPATFRGVEYDVEMTFRENALPPEVWQDPPATMYPATQVFLIGGASGRVLLTEIDHNHSGIGTGVRVAGWLKPPELDRIIVLLLAERRWVGYRRSAPYFLLPIAAKLGGQQQDGS